MLTKSILPAHATSLLVNPSLYSFLRPQAELSHVPNMRLLEPDAPPLPIKLDINGPGHGSHLDSHLVDEGEVDSHILKRRFIFDVLFYLYIYGFKMVKGSPNLIDLIHRSHGIEFNLCCFPSLGVELSVDENWPCAFAPSPVTYLCL